MKTSRMEAFSDGVLAIAITVMVLEMKVPKGAGIAALSPLLPAFGTYAMSFVYLGIYWNNHHNLLTATDEISGEVLWANLHLLFWLSLFPFVSGWMGVNHFAPLPTAFYGIVLLMAAIAWKILQWTLIRSRGRNERLKKAIGQDNKGSASVALYTIAVALAFFLPWAAIAIYVLLAIIWFIPDRRFETASHHES